MESRPSLPWWLPPISRVTTAFIRLGLPLFGQVALAAPGAKTGLRRVTVVWPLKIDGSRYILAGPGRHWVTNVEAAGWAELIHRRRTERVALVDIPPADRGPVIRAFWRRIPAGHRYVRKTFDLPPGATLDDFLADAERYPVFRIETAPAP
jgi:hypothetical protein